jgi:hypothetical protein
MKKDSVPPLLVTQVLSASVNGFLYSGGYANYFAKIFGDEATSLGERETGCRPTYTFNRENDYSFNQF